MYPYYFSQVGDFARNYMLSRIADFQAVIDASEQPHSELVTQMNDALAQLRSQVSTLRYPQED